MTIFKDLFLLQQVDYLIRIRATGTPEQLANRLGICKRNALRLIAQLRDVGFPVAYDKFRFTYYYTREVKISFELIVDNTHLLKIKGGKNIFEEIIQVPDIGTQHTDFCSAGIPYGAQ
jgi:hypothetical protein